MEAVQLRDRILEIIKEYLTRPDIQNNLVAHEALNCLAGDIEVINLD